MRIHPSSPLERLEHGEIGFAPQSHAAHLRMGAHAVRGGGPASDFVPIVHHLQS